MSNRFLYLFTRLFILLSLTSTAQNESKKWYFGTQAGIDFMTNPPSAITTGAMSAWEGCASIADAAGNLLFYTDGITVYNINNVAMANGTGLLGNSSSTQSGVIIKKPGSASIYYIFTLGAMNGPLNFSTVDMTLSAGLGSVTVLNTPLYANSSEKLTAVRHCNGTDVWAISHDMSNNNFRAFLITAAGVSLTPVISSLGTTYTDARGYLKTSPNGKKLGLGDYSGNTFEIYDFNNSTGVVSNQLVLANHNSPYGCEFSPDGTKFYGACEGGGNVIYQWDLCAGSNAAIVASQYTIATATGGLFALQAAANGKIYAVHLSQTYLGVINNPNLYGSSCNYVDNGQSIAPRTNALGLPNFITSIFNTPPSFSYTVGTINNCGSNTASFSAVALQSFLGNPCSGTLSPNPPGINWNFGDPASGSANTSTSTSVTHNFTNLGNYTVTLIANNANFCTGANDTVTQLITIPFCVTVINQAISCSSLGTATVYPQNGIGPFNYTWMPSGQTGSVATGLYPGTYTIYAYDYGAGLTYTTSTTFTSPVSYTATVNNSPVQPCYNVSTGTANISISGGSGNQSYLWTGPSGTQTVSQLSGLTTGNYTVTIIDALTFCTLTKTFVIGPPPPSLSVALFAGSPTVCVGSPVSLIAVGSGGIPLPPSGYNYTWTAGPTNYSYNAVSPVAGTVIYTVTIQDGGNCFLSGTIPVTVTPNPVLSLSNFSICPLQTGSLSVSGANSYTWSTGANTTSISASPPLTTAYTVTGTAGTCTTAATASIVLKALPVPTLASNSSICSGKTLNLFASSGSAYSWTGPFGFVSSAQNPQINSATVNNGGTYNFTLTGANSCTAATAINVTVIASPPLSATGSTVCNTQTINLSVNAPTAISFTWTGPGAFTSTLQNPSIANPPVSASGSYFVYITAANGCTNSAITNVTVSALPVPSFVTDSPKCQGTPLSFNSSGSVGGVFYNWSGPNGFTSTVPNPVILSVVPADAGIYTLQLTTGPCVISTTQSVTIYPTPVPVISGISTLCEDKTFSLSVSPAYPGYQWNGPLGYSTTTQSFTITNAITQQSGMYSAVVTDSNTCSATVSMAVTVMATPSITASGADVCYGSPAVISATGAVNYVWSGPNGFTASTAQVYLPSVTNTSPQSYNVIGTAANSCTGVATVLVTTRVNPVASATLETSHTCVGAPLYFYGKGGSSYEWKGPLNFNSSLQNFSTTAGNPGMTGTYTLTVADEKGCTSYTTVNLIVDGKPQGSLWSSNIERCVPFCSDFKLLTSGAQITSSDWQIDEHIFSTGTFSYCFSKVGDYTIRGNFIDANSCASEIVFVITAYPLPKADFSYSPAEPIENDEINFVSTSNGDGLNNWSWYFASNSDLTEGYYPSAAHVFPNAGVYPVAMVVKNKWGCADTLVEAVTVAEDFYLFVPDAFTPNEDALNEVFRAVGRGVKSFSLMIFDRWGEKVYDGNDIAAGWDGSYKGKPCKSDVYAWKINATSVKGKEKRLSGSVTLYR